MGYTSYALTGRSSTEQYQIVHSKVSATLKSHSSVLLFASFEVTPMVSVAQLVAKNSAYVLAGNLISSIALFGSNVFIARYLAASLFGSYSLVIEFVSLFAMLANFGIDAVLLRQLSTSKAKWDEWISTACTLKILFSVISIITTITVVLLLQYSLPVQLGVLLFSSTLFFGSLTLLFTTILQVRFDMSGTLLASIASKGVLVALVSLFIFLKFGFIAFILALTFSYIIQALMLLWWVRKYWTPILRWAPDRATVLFRESWPLALALSFAAIYNRIDVILLSVLKETQDVGFYSAAYMISGAFSLIPFAFFSSVFPLLAKFFATKKSAFRRCANISFKYMLAGSFIIVILLTVSADTVIKLLFGVHYAPSARALTVLSLSIVFIFLNYFFVNLFVVLKKQKITMIIVGIGVVFNVCANLIMIPRYSFVGAAVTTVATEALNSLLFVAYLRKSMTFVSLSSVLKIFFATGLTILPAIYPNLGLLLRIFLCILTYVSTLWILKVIDSKDIAMIKEIFPIFQAKS